MAVEYGAARQEEKKKTTERIDSSECSEGHTDHWCDRGR